MRPLLLALVITIGFAPQMPGLAQTPVAPKVQVTFEPGGLVSLVANGASIREVLSQWEAKGGTKFNGTERLAGTALTLQFEHRPEIEVMSSLLRGASGVAIADKAEGATGASSIGAVFVVATSNATTGGYTQPSYSAPPPQVSTAGSPDTEIAPAGPGRSGDAAQQPPPSARPAGSGVAVAVVPVTVPVVGSAPPSTGTATTGTATTTGTAGTTTTTGSGRGGGGGGGR